MTLRRITGALLLVAAACSGSSKSGRAGADAGAAAPSAEPVVAYGRCERSPRASSQPYCVDAPSSILVRGDGADAALSAPDDASGESYLHVYDNTCGDGLWALSACASGGDVPCVWISYRGKDGGLCGEYRDRAAAVWNLTALTGEPAARDGTAASRGEHVVTGELVADFESPEGDTLRLTLVVDACGPDFSRCCLC